MAPPSVVDLILRYASLLLGLLDIFAAVVLWIVARTMVSPAEFLALRRRVDLLEQRPGWAQLNAMRADIQELSGEVKGLKASLDAATTTLHGFETRLGRIEVYLLQKE